MAIGPSKIVSEGVKPDSIAARETKGLNVDPACRRAWVARLNFDWVQSYPPTIARIAPVEFSRMRRAPCSVGFWSRETAPPSFCFSNVTVTRYPGLKIFVTLLMPVQL